MEALVVADVQTGITENFEFSRSAIEAIERVVAAARECGMLVVFVRAAMRGSRVDLSERNALMATFFDLGDLFHEESAGTTIDTRVQPLEGEPVVTKRRVSAFFASDLDMILRARGVTEFSIVGLATGAVVLATVLAGIDLDYAVRVIGDGCADPDPETHEFLLERVFPARGASVISSEEWVGSLAS